MRSRVPDAVLLAALLVLAGCGAGEGGEGGGTGADADGADEAGPVEFDPDVTLSDAEAYGTSFADYALDELDPSGVEACEAIPDDEVAELGLSNPQARSSDTATGCNWFGPGGRAQGIELRESTVDSEDASVLAGILYYATEEGRGQEFYSVVSTSGYPSTLLREEIDSELDPGCLLTVALSDRYTMQVNIGPSPEQRPAEACLEDVQEVAEIVMSGF